MRVMAVGDVVSDIQSIAAGADLDFQPAAGVEVMVTHYGVKIGSQLTVSLYNGTLASPLFQHWPTSTTTHPNAMAATKVFITNTNYLRITNQAGTTEPIAYCGIQIGE